MDGGQHGDRLGDRLPFARDPSRPVREGPETHYALSMLILAIILFGMIAGGLAQMVLGRSMRDVNWTVAILTGLIGSFVGGLLASLLAGDGLELRPSGLIGSFVGALLLTLAWGWYDKRRGSA